MVVQKVSKFVLAALLLAGTVMLGRPSSAQAGMVISMSVDGGSFFTVASGASGTTQSFSGNVDSTGIVGSGGVFNLNMVSGSSNSPGTVTNAFLLGSTLSLTNLTSASHTIEIRIGDTDFSNPTTVSYPILVNSHIGGSVTTDGAGNTMTFQSWIDPANGQNTATGFTPGGQNPNITSGSFNSDAFLWINSLAASYSVTQQYTITLDGGSMINWAANTKLTPAPEPGTLVTAFTALPLLGLGAWIRRRQRQS